MTPLAFAVVLAAQTPTTETPPAAPPAAAPADANAPAADAPSAAPADPNAPAADPNAPAVDPNAPPADPNAPAVESSPAPVDPPPAPKPGTLVFATPDVATHGATITVDEAPAGALPLAAPISLAPGVHTVAITKPGYVPMQIVVEVRDGDELVRGVALQSEHPPEDEPAGFAVPPLVPMVVAGVAGAALVGAVVSTVGFAVTEQGVYALDAEWRAARADTSRPFGQKEADQANAEITAAQSVANVWGVAALATGAVAVVAGAGAAVLWLLFTPDAE